MRSCSSFGEFLAHRRRLAAVHAHQRAAGLVVQRRLGLPALAQCALLPALRSGVSSNRRFSRLLFVVIVYLVCVYVFMRVFVTVHISTIRTCCHYMMSAIYVYFCIVSTGIRHWVAWRTRIQILIYSRRTVKALWRTSRLTCSASRTRNALAETDDNSA